MTFVRSPLSRRHFVQGLAGSALLASAGRSFSGDTAESSEARALSRGVSGLNSPSALLGPDFHLTIDTMGVNYTGATRTATTVNSQVPGPLLRMKQGDLITVRVTNRLRSPTSIHWHGMIVPADMDGVPGISFAGIAPGSTFTYRFRANQYGTYWYHAHSRFQEQVGVYGPLISERQGGERHGSDREHVVLLSDWTDLDPEHIYSTLKRESDYYNFGKRTVRDFFADARRNGLKETIADRRMWGEMRMDPTDLLDVSGYAYTYLMNGVTPAGNWTALFQRGERVRLRVINGSSMTFFDVRIPGLEMTVVAADGQDIEPVTVEEFRIGAAEVYDVIVEPHEDRAYTIFAQAMDRSGYARGTLAPRPGLTAETPPLDPRPLLTMQDMGMSHDSTSHGPMNHGAMAHPSAQPHSADNGVPLPAAHDHASDSMSHSPATPPATNGPQAHFTSESSPLVDMQVSQPNTSLNDPGIGLRNTGRKVLTYADLHTLGGPIDRRPPSRNIELHLTGHMQRFVWSFNGRKFSEAEPLRFHHGERLRIILVNDTMMHHPIHLHGMWSELENETGDFLVRKHTVTVQPAQRLSYLVTADALGRWAYHCHLLYHMEAGMFREVVVAHDPDHAMEHGEHGQ
jgi:CopA family copper-resistance protein